jgi:hypothetical protein
MGTFGFFLEQSKQVAYSSYTVQYDEHQQLAP